MDYMLPYALTVFLILIVLRLAFKRNKIGPHQRIPDGLYSGAPPVQFRDGGYVDFNGDPVSGERVVGKHPVLAVQYGHGRRRPIALTPRMLEHVNIQRRMRGVKPLNREGFKAAASLATQSRYDVQPTNSTEWLTYFILYECLFDDHQASRVSGVGGLTINPNLPYNGQGGEYAGAGASGNWDGPGAEIHADALAVRMAGDATDALPAYDRPVEPATSGDGYHYTAPDPVSDSGSSYSSSSSDSSSSSSSSDSSSSSSSDSSSSSSDSGGGGGGGGDGS